MPTFDYVCRECGEVTEVFLRRSGDAGPERCPSCGAARPERRLSAPRGHVKADATAATCCGRDEPCATPACATGTCPR